MCNFSLVAIVFKLKFKMMKLGRTFDSIYHMAAIFIFVYIWLLKIWSVVEWHGLRVCVCVWEGHQLGQLIMCKSPSIVGHAPP
jgi:hypothetical protein